MMRHWHRNFQYTSTYWITSFLFPTTVSLADFVQLTLLVVSFGAEEFVQRLVDDPPADSIHRRTSCHAVRDVTADRLADIVVKFSQTCVVFLQK